MKRFAVQVFVFLMLMAIPLYFLSAYVDSHFYSFSKQKLPWVFHIENTSFDYAVGGSSRAENNVDIRSMNKVFDKKGINIGYSGSGMTEIYLTLYTFLSKGNTIGTYYLQIDPWCLIDPSLSSSYPFHHYFFFPFLKDSIISNVVHSQDKSGHFLLWKYLPFFKYAEFNNIYSLTSAINIGKEPPVLFDKYNGTEFLIGDVHKNFYFSQHYSAKKLFLHPEPQQSLEAIRQLCASRGIKLVLFTVPVERVFDVATDESDYLQYMDKFCSLNNIQFENMASGEMSNDTTCFFNERHLNQKGTLLFSRTLAERIKTNSK